MDIEQLEGLALGDDRAAALAGLVAGTEDHDYWRAIHLQHRGALAEVDALLERWRSRHGDTTARHRLERRQLLLRAGVDLAAVADRLRDETGATLHHEPEIEAAAARHPSRFADEALAADKLLDLALSRGRGLDEITAAGLPLLIGRPLDAARSRLLLERLDRTGLPGLVPLVAAELAEKGAKGFGTLAIHQRLTRAELDELAALRPALRQHKAWVEAMVTRLRPPAHVDWELDPDARVAYLDALWREVEPLPPSFNSLKAHVLYHRLAWDLRADACDRHRLRAYLALPRRGTYVRAAWLKDLEQGIVAALDHDFGRITGLPTVVDDEPLIRTYLASFLRVDDGDDFAAHVEASWLERLRAETRLLSGDPDVDRWTAVLGAAAVTALRDRVDLELAPTNPRRHGRDAAVTLDVDVKHAGALRVRVFRIDVAAHFHARGSDVDTTLDLDGLAAGWEELRPWTAPALHRVRTRLALAACDRPGTYVVELIAGGKASRALVRKGDLRYTTRASAAGVALTVLDEAGGACPTASVWMGGREYRPRDGGDITLPFSTRGGATPILLVDGDLAVVTAVQLPTESYDLAAAVLLDRQALVPGQDAVALVRADLAIGGVPAPLALLEEPYAEIVATDRAGVPARRRQPLVLADGAEVELTIAVPDNAASLAVAIGGRARVVSEQRTVELRREVAMDLGTMHASLATEALYLVRDADGFALALYGKSGEPRVGRAVALELRLAVVGFLWQVTLATDEAGRIALGHLAGVLEVHATTSTGLDQRFAIAAAAPSVPALITARAGDDVVVPVAVAAAAPDWTVIEQRGGAPAHDHGACGRLEPGVLRLRGLPAGEHVVAVRGQAAVTVVVVPAAAPVAGGWVTLPRALVELRPPTPALGAVVASAATLDLDVLGASPHTRVHVVATCLWPAPAWSGALATRLRAPQLRRQAPAETQYVSGRDIGDEYRYVLDRQHAPRRAGLLLDRPSVLLNPWALRATATASQTARGETAWAAGGARPAPAPAMAPGGYGGGGPQAGADVAFAAYDFLAATPVVRANLRPDAAGHVRVARADLGDATVVHVICVDPGGVTSRVVALPPRPLAVRDLRLAAALPAERHLREDRRLQGLPAGATLTVADRATTRVELVDSVDKLYRALCALSGDGELAAWDFLPRWGALPRAEKLALYSKHACHELALFIYVKDRPLFDEALRPYLASKLHPTFVDHWLLDADLTPYLTSWRFARLNALERALLARRLPDARAAIARTLADAVELMPPDPDGDDRLVDAFLAGGKLSGDGTDVAAAEPAPEPRDARRSGGRARAAELSLDEADEVADRAPPKAKKAMRPPSAPPPPPSAPMAQMMAPPPGSAGFAPPGDFDVERLRADLAERASAAPLYRGADKTQEWAEHNWWHTRVADAGPDHVPVCRLWRDLAAHGDGPFLSPHVAGVATGFAACVAALALLELPFAAAPHGLVARGAGAEIRAGSHALVAVAALAEVAGPPLGQVLVGQSYFRADDRWEWDGAEQREKYVTGELLTAVVYQCQVVVTNPSSRVQRLAVLLQIPAGAIAVQNGVATRTHRIELGAYATTSLEVAFYLPAPGTFAHYGARITRGDELVAAAAARELTVVRAPTTVDAASWAHVSQRGSLDEVVGFLATHNLGRVDLTRVAWRLRERVAFDRILATLAARHVHEPSLWAYALVHGDAARAAEWLAHQDDFLAAAGPDLDGGLVPLEPVARGRYQHLEYAPLINARAHRLGERRTVLNDGLAAQWRTFLERVATRRAPGADDWLAAAHYLFTMDRADDGARALGHAGAPGPAALQHAYLAAYAAAARGDLDAARRWAAPHAGHPVDRWRHRFAALLAMLDEVAGVAPAADVGARDHRERTLDAAAAATPSLAIAVDQGAVVVTHAHLARAQLRFYRMDVELLFSRQPFLGAATDRFSFIAPGAALDVALAAGGRTTVRLPDTMAQANLVVDAVAGALRASVTHFANDLAVAVTAPYGQLQVRQASSGVALAATYVKAYARMRGGAVAFFKDGYTDLRGRFDYATLSTSDLDNVERFALLVLHDQAGATVIEAEPPVR